MKLVIDTDPGIDDAMAILMAFQSPEVELLGITTVFGNLSTPMATENAIRLREMAGREEVPIAREANIFGDPDAADIVFSSGCNIFAVGLDVTHRCVFKEEDREELNRHQAGHGPFIHRITDFYLGYHKRSYHMNGFYLHDPAAFAILLKPWLCKWKQGIIRVLREGVGKGMTVMDPLERQWIGENEWTRHPAVQVAMEVNAEGVIQLVKERMGWEEAKEADP
eukprot:jgi/Pico_ML_1/51461/g2488.t1